MKNEKQLARHMLVHRECGYSLLYILRRSIWRYALLIGAWVALLVAFLHAEDPWQELFFMWGFGMLGGAILRDCAWFRRIRKSWPFTEKITDWEKVKRIAEADESANQPSEGIRR